MQYIITKGHTPLGYIEAKDIGKPLAEVEKSEQLKRYLESLGNLVLTDYLEFRWYVAGQHRLTARLASIVNGKIKADKDGEQQVQELLQAFLTAKASTVYSTITGIRSFQVSDAGDKRSVSDITLGR